MARHFDDLPGSDTARLPAHIREHLPHAEEVAYRNVARVNSASRPGLAAAQALVRSASRPGVPVRLRTMMLRQAAHEWSAAQLPYAACRHGCSHCCHISVSVPETEARLIAKKTGTPLSEPLAPRTVWEDGTETTDRYFGVACVFLKNGRCSIYEHRPFACRTLVNMDDVELLCELRTEGAVPVPYADARALQAVYLAALQKDRVADVRDWFRRADESAEGPGADSSVAKGSR